MHYIVRSIAKKLLISMIPLKIVIIMKIVTTVLLQLLQMLQHQLHQNAAYSYYHYQWKWLNYFITSPYCCHYYHSCN